MAFKVAIPHLFNHLNLRYRCNNPRHNRINNLHPLLHHLHLHLHLHLRLHLRLHLSNNNNHKIHA